MMYRERLNAQRLAAQALPVKKLVKEILKEIESIQSCLYWALDPEDDSGLWPSSMIEHAHALVDLSHEYKAALKADPPPQEIDDEVA